jgi:hypothetical protein
MLDNNLCSAACGKSTLLVSLVLSAAFDTIDHSIPLNRLIVSGTVNAWLESYLTGIVSKCVLAVIHLLHRTQIWPLFSSLSICTSHISASYSVAQRQCADNTHHIASSSPDFTTDLRSLERCPTARHFLFCHSGLTLNPVKSDATLFSTRRKSYCYSDATFVDVAGTVVQLQHHIKLLGMTFDQHLSALRRLKPQRRILDDRTVHY